MAIRVEHELHGRRRGRNLGVGLVLLVLTAIMFGLTVVKVLNLGDVRQMGASDRLIPPAFVSEDGETD